MNKKIYIIILIIVAIAFESLTYAIGKLSPFEPTLLSSNIDNNMPFIEYFVYPYFSWYICLLVIPFILYLKDSPEFYKYIACCLMASAISFVIFMFFPTTVTRPEIQNTSLSTWLVNMIYKADTPALDCFPSMHCALAALFIICSFSSSKLNKTSKLIIYLISLSIILSTVYIKQHVLYDVFGGVVLAFISYIIANKFKLYIKIQQSTDIIYNKIFKK